MIHVCVEACASDRDSRFVNGLDARRLKLVLQDANTSHLIAVSCTGVKDIVDAFKIPADNLHSIKNQSHLPIQSVASLQDEDFNVYGITVHAKL